MTKQSPKQVYIAAKMHEIKKEGIRGKAVPQKQAIAVALSEARRKGYG